MGRNEIFFRILLGTMWVVCENTANIVSYTLILRIQVVRAKKKGSEHVYALKIMDKDFIIKENKVTCVKLERIVLDQLDHPGIVGLYFTFQDARCLCKSYHVFYFRMFICLILLPAYLILY